MHSVMTPRIPRRDEHGAVAIVVAISLTAMLVIVAMVLDFGLVRVDRQVDKSAADSATLAGLHGLNGGDSTPRPFAGVCSAINYLRQNNDRFSALASSAGGWSDGDGISIPGMVADPCTDSTWLKKPCVAAHTSWATFSWTGSMDGKPLNVIIKSGYVIPAGSSGSEDALPASRADNNDFAQGCDQLAVFINQQRAPGLGSLATTSDLKTSIRTVGRVKQETGGYAPAMLLLEQHACPVLKTGSSAGTSFIHVLGAQSSDGQTQPGTIHSDSDASSCTGGTNSNVFQGFGTNGIVAYAAPVAGSPTVPDAAKPGILSSVAMLTKALNFTIDTAGTLTNAYSATGIDAGAPGTHNPPVGLPRVTRAPIDNRYFTGVKNALSGASTVFGPGGTTGWTTYSGNQCKPTQATINALSLDVNSKLFINCTTNAGFDPGALTIPAGTVFFNGIVGSSGNLVLSKAHHVYVAGLSGKDAIVLGGSGSAFSMNTTGNLDGTGHCSVGQNSSKAVLFVKQGGIVEGNNNSIRFCRTTVMMMGGQASVPNIGCVPTNPGQAPTTTPCPGSVAGTGLIKQTGGDIDWTAPDVLDVTTLPDGTDAPAAVAAWQDVNGPEDLALWSESAGSYSMNGSGVSNVRGVFMVPNAFPFSIGGGASMNLTNAQFVSRTILLNGSTTAITMRVDGNSVVRLPKLTLVGLVR